VSSATGIVLVKIAEFNSVVPIHHKSRAVNDHRSLEREYVMVDGGVDCTEPYVWSVAKEASDDRRSIELVGKEEHVVEDPALDEIERPFIFVSFLVETHLLPFSRALLDPNFIEEVHLYGFVQEDPALTDGVTELEGLRLPPLLRSIREFKWGHGAEIDYHLRGEAY
jgi:hypothetical protein